MTEERRVVVIIPARNEEKCIEMTLKSVYSQTHRVDRVIVIANNCTDNTAKMAREDGAEVIEMLNNKHMKSGALNRALEQIMPELDDKDCILVMDADTNLSLDLVEKCLQKLKEEVLAGAVGSIFTGRPSKSLLGTMQLMEYWRYKRQIHRNGDKAFVLSGTASLFLVKTLKAVKNGRSNGSLPNGGGSYYDILGRTEDNEITLAILKLGYKCPTVDAFSVTDVMETVDGLKNQRERWYNGAMVNLKAYGQSLPWNMKWVYWSQQIGLLFSLITFISICLLMLICIIFGVEIKITWIWLVPIVVLLAERVRTVWQLGWKVRLIAIMIVPEQIYSIYLLLIYGLALINFVFKKKGQWHQT